MILTKMLRNSVIVIIAWFIMGGIGVAHAVPIVLTSAKARGEILRIENYFNRIGTLRSHFIQVNPDGSSAQGKFYLKRPSKMRFEYSPPDPFLFVSTGDFFIYVDKQLQEATYLHNDEAPLSFLLKPRVKLQSDKLRLTKMDISANILTLELSPTQNNYVRNLQLVFSISPIALKQWSVLTQQSDDIRVTLQNVEYGVSLSDDLFRFRADWQNNQER